jgi:hypothetical protein
MGVSCDDASMIVYSVMRRIIARCWIGVDYVEGNAQIDLPGIPPDACGQRFSVTKP